MERKEEARVVRAAAAGCRSSSERLVLEHQRSLYSYIYRMCGRPEVAEDIVQEAFIRALTHLDRFDPTYRFSTWIFTIARRLYINDIQRLRPRTGHAGLESGARRGSGPPPAPQASAEARDQRDSDKQGLQAALAELRPEQREVLLLFHQQNWPIALIADHLGVPEGTVKSHLHRGRARLRSLLAREDRRSLERRTERRDAFRARSAGPDLHERDEPEAWPAGVLRRRFSPREATG